MNKRNGKSTTAVEHAPADPLACPFDELFTEDGGEQSSTSARQANAARRKQFWTRPSKTGFCAVALADATISGKHATVSIVAGNFAFLQVFYRMRYWRWKVYDF